jgi:hypothetical protein
MENIEKYKAPLWRGIVDDTNKAITIIVNDDNTIVQDYLDRLSEVLNLDKYN